MPPTLILIRHAQALHNVASDWSLHDPPLSELGEQQCAELQASLKKEAIANKVDLIVVSAMRRTLQTAKLGLRWLIEEKKVPVLVDAGWQGASTFSMYLSVQYKNQMAFSIQERILHEFLSLMKYVHRQYFLFSYSCHRSR
jgi:phosphohistidine phosphatase SixA